MNTNCNRMISVITLTAVFLTGLVFTESDVFQTEVSANVPAEQNVSTEAVVENLGASAVYFEENKGQFNGKVRYFARGTKGYGLFLTGTDAVYVVSDNTTVKTREAADFRNPKAEIETPKSAVAVYMSLVGANENSTFGGSQMLEHRTNYFKGDESDWRTEIPNYQTVQMNNVYEGIDLVWRGKEQGGVQYDFVVAPNANPNQIGWDVKGAKEVELTAEGDILIKTEYGDIKQNKPFTYQDANGARQEISSRFVVEKDGGSQRITFELGDYDRSKPLTIDPSVNLSNLSFSTFLGGSSDDIGYAIATDSAENVYVTGYTLSSSFPTTAGAFDTT